MNVNLATNSGKITRLNGKDTTIDLGSYSHRVGYTPFDWFSYKVLSATFDPATQDGDQPDVRQRQGSADAVLQRVGRDHRAESVPRPFAAHAHRLVDEHHPLRRPLPAVRNVRLRRRLQAAGQQHPYSLPDLSYMPRVSAPGNHRSAPARADAEQRNPAGLRVQRRRVHQAARGVALVRCAVALAARAGARDLAFVLSARNLHTWTSYTGLDPESRFVSNNGPGIDQAELPQLAQFVVTVRLGY